MTSIAQPSRDPRLPSAVWFIAGAGVAAAVLLRPTPAAVADSGSAVVLVRSPCISPIPLQLGTSSGSAARTANLRGPGLYRVAMAGDVIPDLVVATPGGRRPATDLPIGDSGELLIPDEWCQPPDGSAGLGSVGLLGQ